MADLNDLGVPRDSRATWSPDCKPITFGGSASWEWLRSGMDLPAGSSMVGVRFDGDYGEGGALFEFWKRASLTVEVDGLEYLRTHLECVPREDGEVCSFDSGGTFPDAPDRIIVTIAHHPEFEEPFPPVVLRPEVVFRLPMVTA